MSEPEGRFAEVTRKARAERERLNAHQAEKAQAQQRTAVPEDAVYSEWDSAPASPDDNGSERP